MLAGLQKKSVAALITACIVVLSVVLGAGASLTRLRGEYNDIFYYGSDGSWQGINYDLVEIYDNSMNLLTVAGRYLDENDLRVAAVERNANNVLGNSSYKARHNAAAELRSSLDELDAVLAEIDLSQEDDNYRIKLMATIASHYKIIDQSGYNDAAREFNRILETFPANILSSITGVRPLELYE